MADPPKTHVTFIRNSKLKHIEARFCRYTGFAFQKHFHDTYAVGVVEQGKSSYFHRNTTELIGPGTIALINPGEIHACNPQPGSVWTYKMFYIEDELIRTIASELSGHDEEPPLFTAAIIDRPWLYQALLRLYTVILTSENTLEKDIWIHKTLSQLLLDHSHRHHSRQLPERSFQATQRAYEYLMANISENISLQQLSSVAGLSAYHLLRVFQHRYGLPPHMFQIQQRVNLAKKMLAKGMPIVQVAFELGFADQSHFTKKFKPMVGATPRQYQLAVR